MKARTTYLFIGGPAHGAEAIFGGEPQTKTVDREAYVLTYVGNATFYRHHTLAVDEAIREYLQCSETAPLEAR